MRMEQQTIKETIRNMRATDAEKDAIQAQCDSGDRSALLTIECLHRRQTATISERFLQYLREEDDA